MVSKKFFRENEGAYHRQFLSREKNSTKPTISSMALVLAVKMELFLKDFYKSLRQSIARFPFVLETDFSFRGGLDRNRYHISA